MEGKGNLIQGIIQVFACSFREKVKEKNQVYNSPNRDLNQEPLRYKGALNLLLQRSVHLCTFLISCRR